jgi:hypothetical protein
MKIISTIGFLLLGLSLRAAVLNVSNLPGNGFPYNNVDAAMIAASPGDTIYVHGSNIQYPDFTITKSIVILGTGGFTQTEFGLSSRFSRITFSSNTSNIEINGVVLEYYHIDFYALTNIHHVVIKNCYFNQSTYSNIRFSNLSNSSDIRIFNNVLGGGNSQKIEFYNNPNCFNIIIDHNIINGSIQNLGIINTIIQNNIFYNPSSGTAFTGSNSFAIVSNNIFYNCEANANMTSGIFNNNMTYSSSATLALLGGTNFDNVNPQFVNAPASGNYLPSNNFNLQAGSPAIAAGSDGLDLGYYGGLEAVSPIGEPRNMPVIRKMNIQNPSVPQNGNVNVKVRSTKSRTN